MLEFYPTIQINSKVDYLKQTELVIQLRNRSSLPILVDEIALVFKSGDDSVPEELVTVRHLCNGHIWQPNELEYESVSVRPSLTLYPYTNMCKVKVTYRVQEHGGFGGPVTEIVDESTYLIINDAPPLQGKTHDPASIFVSFKDPEDLELAMIAVTLLKRAGFIPYLACNDHRTGSTYWDAKIEPAIRNAEATLVIWTPNTGRHPDAVIRELRYSVEVGTPVGLFLEHGTPLPTEYPRDKKEYGGPFRRDLAFVEFAKEIEACTQRWRQGQGFF